MGHVKMKEETENKSEGIMKKRIAATTAAMASIMAIIIIAASMAGCDTAGNAGDSEQSPTQPQPPASEGGTMQYDERGAIRIMNLTAMDLLEPGNVGESAPAQAVASGANDFAFRLSAALAGNIGDGNFVCSPYSVWIPLAALVNATDDANKPALLEALGAQGVSEADINKAASRMLFDLTKQWQKNASEEQNGDPAASVYDPLKIANAIFVGNDVTLKQSFAQTFLDYFRGVSMNVDFGSNEAVEAVNKWASENTEGLITDIVEEFEPETIAALANAIYFSDRWLLEFDPEETVEDVFHSPAGDTTAQFMLLDNGSSYYYEDDRVQAMPLRFTLGDGLYIILPKDGDAAGLLSSMTNEYFDKIQNDSIMTTGKLLLPRFTIESDVIELRDTLKALGAPLFDAKAAPLTGGVIEEDIPAWVSSVAHKAMIEVDEEGATAAAVTVVAVYGASMPLPAEPFEMNCNKPFVFVLFGNTYDGGSQVLFTGIVNKP